MIVDVSMEVPPYLTTDKGLPLYKKLPTESKVVPSPDDVARFLSTLDDFWAQKSNKHLDVAVHCHYGFNRTGFFVCAYLIERQNVSAAAAIEMVRRSKGLGEGRRSAEGPLGSPAAVHSIIIRRERCCHASRSLSFFSSPLVRATPAAGHQARPLL